MSDLFVGKKKNGAPKIVAKKAFLEFAAEHDATEEAHDYSSVLKRKKAANSERAWKGRLQKLHALAAQGQSIKEVIAMSADSGWTGLFEVNNDKSRVRSSESTVSAREARNRAAYERAGGT